MQEVRKKYSQSVDRALDVLECFRPGEEENGISELSRRLQLSPSIVQRLVATLTRRGYLSRCENTRKYRLGIKNWELGCLSISHFGIRDLARPHLEELARKSGETVHLSILDQETNSIIYIDKIEGDQPVRAYTYLGGRAPAYCVATGKAILAYQSESVFKKILGRSLQGFTSSTITRPSEIQKHLEIVRKEGYASNRGEWRKDVGGIAAPIFDYTNRAVAAVGVTAPVSRLSLKRFQEVLPLVKETALRISRDLGYLAQVPSGKSRKAS